MRIGAGEIGSTPEIDPAARVDAAVIRLGIRGHVLRHDADAADRPLFEARDVYVEQGALALGMCENTFDDVAGQLRGTAKVERLRLGILERHSDAGLAEEGA